MKVKHLKEGGALPDAGGAAHLPDRVHGELRSPNVDHGDAEARGQDGSDGGSTRAVVPHHHILQDEEGQRLNGSITVCATAQQ